MSELYQQLYSYLAGQVDDTLQYMTHTLLIERSMDREHVLHAMEMLKNALQAAEERYLAAGEND